MINDELLELTIRREAGNLYETIKVILKEKSNSITQSFTNETVIA